VTSDCAAPAAYLVLVQRRGLAAYQETIDAMRVFTESRSAATADELWLLEHPPVYTLGQGADAVHGPRVANGIPLITSGRGGEITYHGPGQLVVYTLIDLARRGIGVREFVRLLENALIELLAGYDIHATRRDGAPGVYVGEAKVAALGIRVTRGRAWHGLALNVDMDLTPFSVIDPCGYAGLPVTQTRDLGIDAGVAVLGDELAAILIHRLADVPRFSDARGLANA
jgi:lipoyl(octanoyl) transferase